MAGALVSLYLGSGEEVGVVLSVRPRAAAAEKEEEAAETRHVRRGVVSMREKE